MKNSLKNFICIPFIFLKISYHFEMFVFCKLLEASPISKRALSESNQIDRKRKIKIKRSHTRNNIAS